MAGTQLLNGYETQFMSKDQTRLKVSSTREESLDFGSILDSILVHLTTVHTNYIQLKRTTVHMNYVHYCTFGEEAIPLL